MLPRFDSSFRWYTTSLQLHGGCFSSITVSLDRSSVFVYCKIVCNLCLRVYPLCVCTLFWLFALCFFFRGKFFEEFSKRVILLGSFVTRNFVSEISSLLNAFCFYRIDKENFLIIRKLLKISRWKKWTPPLAKNVLSYYPVARWKFAFWRLLIVFRIFSFHPSVWFLKIRLFRVFFNNW